jgi:3-oxoadipate enol-lactonase
MMAEFKKQVAKFEKIHPDLNIEVECLDWSEVVTKVTSAAVAAARVDMQRRGISPPAGERMAREEPALHFLYQAIGSTSGAFDREELRKRLTAMATWSPDVLRGFSMPILFVCGDEDTTYPPFRSDALTPLMPNTRVEHVRESGHSVYFQQASVFNQLVNRFLAAIG